MLKRKLRAAIVGSILLACTAIAPALASGSSPTDTEVQQDKMKDDKMGQDKMDSRSESFDFVAPKKAFGAPKECAGSTFISQVRTTHTPFLLAIKETS